MIRLLSSLLLFAALPAWADAVSDQLTAAGIVEFTAAYQAWDGQRFGAAAELFRQASTNAPANVTNFYWLGAAEFHRCCELQPGRPPTRSAADAAMEAALAALTTAVKLDERHAESHALLGDALRHEDQRQPAARRAVWPARGASIEELAMEFGATDPRVRYLLGMCQFHTAKKPADWREALATLLAAEKLFQPRTTSPPRRWNRAGAAAVASPSLGGPTKGSASARRRRTIFARRWPKHPADHLAKAGLARVTGKEVRHK